MSSGSTKRNPDMRSLFLSKVPVNEPLQIPQRGPYGESCPLTRPFLHIYQIPYKIKKFIPSLKEPRKGASLHVPQKRGSYGNRRPFPEPYLAYLSGSPVKEPSFQVPLPELPRREMHHSKSPPFIFQRPRYTSHLPGSATGPLWR